MGSLNFWFAHLADYLCTTKGRVWRSRQLRKRSPAVLARVPGVRVVDRREGGGRWFGKLREGPGDQCAGRAVQGVGAGECTIAPSSEALGVRHRDEANLPVDILTADILEELLTGSSPICDKGAPDTPICGATSTIDRT
jgi:hypothetical protein